MVPCNGPKLKTTRMFRPFRQVAAPGAKSAVCVCILLLFVSKAPLNPNRQGSRMSGNSLVVIDVVV